MTKKLTKQSITFNTLEVGDDLLKAKLAENVYRDILKYLSRAILGNSILIEDRTELQRALHQKVSGITEFAKYETDPDLRLEELIAVTCLSLMLNARQPSTLYMPAWQKPGKKTDINKLTGEESWDGFIVGINTADNKNDMILSPVELKSTMSNPNDSIQTDVTTQAIDVIQSQASSFQNAGAIHGMIVMPYHPSSGNRTIQLDKIAKELRSAAIDTSSCAFFLISFPENDYSSLQVHSIVIIDGMDHNNLDEWIKTVTFKKI
jgi:hypothetical protein